MQGARLVSLVTHLNQAVLDRSNDNANYLPPRTKSIAILLLVVKAVCTSKSVFMN